MRRYRSIETSIRKSHVFSHFIVFYDSFFTIINTLFSLKYTPDQSTVSSFTLFLGFQAKSLAWGSEAWAATSTEIEKINTQ